jgi:uroporphyrin-III C-methyltransferase
MEGVDYETALAAGDVPARGEVWLVGAGPGDPDLLTLRAASALRRADLILHDTQPARMARSLARPGATVVDVGKRKGAAPTPQAKINARLVAGARAGLRVVRLKAGDPFLFARGGEEAAALNAAGIPWRVVPGVSAGLAAPAAAGIALTQRGQASAVTFLTAHDEAGGLPASLDFAALARSGSTLVAFMALSRLDELVVALLAAGMAAATPAALVSRASLPDQARLTTTLGRLTLAAQRAGLPGPALVVVGAPAAGLLALAEATTARPPQVAAG